ncbi:hypothetical protein D3C87_456090 [compost metagenome]
MASAAPRVISSSTSLVMDASSARTAGDENSGSVAATTSCSASSISPSPISTRPTRPATVAERVMNSTTPTKMNIGESHERSAENSTEISAVPTSAPRITASAAGSVTRPCPTKEEVMSDVAVLDCTSAVTPMPESAAVKRLRMLCTRILRRLAPKTRSTPVRTRCVPHTSRATAASRFRRCFMEGGV